MSPVVNTALAGVRDGADPFVPRTTIVPPHARRAIVHAIRSDAAGFYATAANLAGRDLPLFETLTGDFTCSCPLPSHPPVRPTMSAPLTPQDRHSLVALALRATHNSPSQAASPPRPGRPLRLHHADSGAGWRCSACGSGSPVQFLSRLFFLPTTNADVAAWNLAARMVHIDPAAVDARAWLPWDADTAHFEWGKAIAYTRAYIDKLRPLYQTDFPSWRDTEILQFPSTGRGTYLVAYRVRGRLTQLEEVGFPSASGNPRPQRRVRFHHWSGARPTSLARSVTGVYPDTAAARPADTRLTDPASHPPVQIVYVVQGAEHAASARSLAGASVVGTPCGPLGLGQADVDALARFDRVYVWADQTPAGRGYQSRMVRLFRACGIDAQAVRWSHWAKLPRGYNLTQFVRDQGKIEIRPDGTLQLRLPDRSFNQLALALGA